MSKVILEGFFVVPDEDISRVLRELPNHIALTRKEEGCLVFEVIQDAENTNRYKVYEEFADKASYHHHQDRVRAS